MRAWCASRSAGALIHMKETGRREPTRRCMLSSEGALNRRSCGGPHITNMVGVQAKALAAGGFRQSRCNSDTAAPGKQKMVKESSVSSEIWKANVQKILRNLTGVRWSHRRVMEDFLLWAPRVMCGKNSCDLDQEDEEGSEMRALTKGAKSLPVHRFALRWLANDGSFPPIELK